MTGDSSGRVLAAYDPLQRRRFAGLHQPARAALVPLPGHGATAIFLLLDPSLTDRTRAHGADSRRLGGRRIRARILLPHATPAAALDRNCCAWPSINTPTTIALRQEFLRDYFGDLARGAGFARGRRSGRDPQWSVGSAAGRGPAGRRIPTGTPSPAADAAAGGNSLDGSRGIPRRWNCASTGARASPKPEQQQRFGDEAIPMIDR